MGKGTLRTVSVTTRLDGSELRIPVHEVKGDRDGPTLTLVSTLHGAEWFSVEIVRRVLAELAPGELRGRVVGIPVANLVALEHFTRMTPDESDEPELNRVWPGGTTWITEQIAAALDKERRCQFAQPRLLHPLATRPWGRSGPPIPVGEPAHRAIERFAREVIPGERLDRAPPPGPVPDRWSRHRKGANNSKSGFPDYPFRC